MKIATWNDRTINQTGKFETVEKEVMRVNRHVIGVSGVRWIGEGQITADKTNFEHSVGEKH